MNDEMKKDTSPVQEEIDAKIAAMNQSPLNNKR